MKLELLASALSMALATTASAVSMQQERQVNGSGAATASAEPRQPLFIIKYVLVREQPDTKDSPRIDLGDGQAAIRALPLAGQGQTMLSDGGFGDPNTFVCRGWDCEEAH